MQHFFAGEMVGTPLWAHLYPHFAARQTRVQNPSPPAPRPEYRARGARSKHVGKDEPSEHATLATSAISWLILGGWIPYSCESPTAVQRSGMLSRLEAELSRLEAESCTNQKAHRSWYPHRNRQSVLRNRRSSWCWWHTIRNHLRHVASEHLGNPRRMAHPHCLRCESDCQVE